jgi:hypothetical protein
MNSTQNQKYGTVIAFRSGWNWARLYWKFTKGGVILQVAYLTVENLLKRIEVAILVATRGQASRIFGSLYIKSKQ